VSGSRGGWVTGILCVAFLFIYFFNFPHWHVHPPHRYEKEALAKLIKTAAVGTPLPICTQLSLPTRVGLQLSCTYEVAFKLTAMSRLQCRGRNFDIFSFHLGSVLLSHRPNIREQSLHTSGAFKDYRPSITLFVLLTSSHHLHVYLSIVTISGGA
jgi:hypothetical protein